jgi:hypothetical protein
MKSKLLQRLEAASLRLEERGVLYRNGFQPGRDGEACIVWYATNGGDVFELMLAEVKRDLVAEDKVIHEVRNSVALFFNVTIDRPDGWWWGLDANACLYGPFESSEAAVEDARAASQLPIRIITHGWEDLVSEPDVPDHIDGYVSIIVVDTDGEICRTMKEVAEGDVAEGRGKPS